MYLFSQLWQFSGKAGEGWHEAAGGKDENACHKTQETKQHNAGGQAAGQPFAQDIYWLAEQQL